MPKFAVHGKVVGSTFLGVFEAKDADEAVEKAMGESGGFVSLCHQCARSVEDPEIVEATAELEE